MNADTTTSPGVLRGDHHPCGHPPTADAYHGRRRHAPAGDVNHLHPRHSPATEPDLHRLRSEREPGHRVQHDEGECDHVHHDHDR